MVPSAPTVQFLSGSGCVRGNVKPHPTSRGQEYAVQTNRIDRDRHFKASPWPADELRRQYPALQVGAHGKDIRVKTDQVTDVGDIRPTTLQVRDAAGTYKTAEDEQARQMQRHPVGCHHPQGDGPQQEHGSEGSPHRGPDSCVWKKESAAVGSSGPEQRSMKHEEPPLAWIGSPPWPGGRIVSCVRKINASQAPEFRDPEKILDLLVHETPQRRLVSILGHPVAMA